MHRVIWLQFSSIRRHDCSFVMQDVPLPNRSGELLLQQILRMPREGKSRVSFNYAMTLFTHAMFDHMEDPKGTRESFLQFKDRMVQWISDQGYWVELSGNEFFIQRDGYKLGEA
jgi:hypothetical protein